MVDGDDVSRGVRPLRWYDKPHLGVRKGDIIVFEGREGCF